MRRPLLTLLAFLTLLTLGAAPARADWTGLPGLTAAGWVREYTVALPSLTMYAATEGNGVYRSTSGGLTWESFSSGLNTVPGAMNVRTVFTSGSDVYAGTSSGLFKSTGGMGAFEPVAQGPEPDPKNPTKLNAAVQTVFTGLVPGQMLAGVASGGVYKSSDGGKTWKAPAPDNGMARSESVWSLGSYKDGLIYAASQSGIYISTNFGSTWTLSSDGISGITLRTFADEKWPNIYYASGTDGVFRSINAGLTWTSIEGPAGKTLGGGQVRDLVQFSGINTKRLYAATENGVYAGRTGIGVIPGEVTWRKVTNAGLGNNTIFWALESPVPGTLVSGTQSNGGYLLVFQPPIAGAKPVLSNYSPKRSELLTTTTGTWSGTPEIEFEYQWQDCTAVCVDIAGETGKTFVVPAQSRKYRVHVVAKNEVPTLDFAENWSNITNASTAQAADLPGAAQTSKTSIRSLADADGFPQPGEKLEAYDYKVSNSTSFRFQWFRCAGAVCTPLPGQVESLYTLTDDDVTFRLCAEVTGVNNAGATTLECGQMSNEIFPKSPKAFKPTTMGGSAYVGDTLISGVGAWEVPTTQFKRQWEACEPNGSSCATINGAKGSTYVVKPAELGKRLRVRLAVDSNADNKKPDPIEVFTPLSAVVTPPPPPPVIPETGGSATPTPTPTPIPQNNGQNTPPPPPPAADKTAPAIVGTSVAKNAQLTLTLSEPANVTVVVQRAKAGHLKGKKCKAGGKKGKKCTVLSTVSSSTVSAPAGARTIALAKKKLGKGDYRAVITAVDGAGNKTSKTVSFKVK